MGTPTAVGDSGLLFAGQEVIYCHVPGRPCSLLFVTAPPSVPPSSLSLIIRLLDTDQLGLFHFFPPSIPSLTSPSRPPFYSLQHSILFYLVPSLKPSRSSIVIPPTFLLGRAPYRLYAPCRRTFPLDEPLRHHRLHRNRLSRPQASVDFGKKNGKHTHTHTKKIFFFFFCFFSLPVIFHLSSSISSIAGFTSPPNFTDLRALLFSLRLSLHPLFSLPEFSRPNDGLGPGVLYLNLNPLTCT